MRTLLVGTGLVVAGLAVCAAGQEAQAQYYPYAPPPPYSAPPPGYYPPPPPPGRRVGYRCDAYLPTYYGPRREICEIVEPRPLGRPCICPPPPPPPGYPFPPPLRGRVVP